MNEIEDIDPHENADDVKKVHHDSTSDHRFENEPSVPPAGSEEALALGFAVRHQHELRYVHGLHKWLMLGPTHWQFEETLRVIDFARPICREAAAAVAAINPRAAAAIASAKTVMAVVSLARADRRLAGTIEQWDHDPWVLNTPGGIVDLRTGDLRALRPDDYVTKITGAAPDARCPTPKWKEFLHRTTGGDDTLVSYLQRVGGYSLTGITRDHAMFFLHGCGANGKSVFVNTLAACFGSYHRTAPIETFTASRGDRHPTELASLRGARLVTATETEEGRHWAEAKIKALTGGDAVSARFMRQDFFEFIPQFKLVIAGNHRPGLRNLDEAIRRRLHLIPFSVTIPKEERDETLLEKLKVELPGIMAWLIDGCLDWQERRLAPPEAVTGATEQYFEAEDAFTEWIVTVRRETGCAVHSDQGLEHDHNKWESTSSLFKSWKKDCERTGERCGSAKWLSQTLQSRETFMRDGVIIAKFTFKRTKEGSGFFGLQLPRALLGEVDR